MRFDKIKTYFWNRFSSEYLSELSEHHKHAKVSVGTCEAKVGDVVLLKHEVLPRHLWKLGKIVDVKPGRDGLV